MYHMLSHTLDYHPSCHENLSHAFAQFNRPPELISTTFNIFMNYEIDQNGTLHLRRPLNTPGDFIVFRALEDLIVGLTACADEATNDGMCKPIDYVISRTEGHSANYDKSLSPQLRRLHEGSAKDKTIGQEGGSEAFRR
jgi:uncharacterized protein YcgI (DUF1989 family)